MNTDDITNTTFDDFLNQIENPITRKKYDKVKDRYDYEMVFVDDGSKDDSALVIKKICFQKGTFILGKSLFY